ncbi:uncharacterized protein PV09_04255 [Verruconis gallopava]|uniref:FAD/NAD(P)-binding domain-containing protein n=1 Tax=Verruconis gallopava TaxID=253628 RepID=A0A0D2ACC6_9PEZI|nr:uncharacterized protein PV09_04255 [Verruconis gallopava]KIW04498.1 hypothetical protein PV09_04255 [Verruconis gallopava]
MRVAVIGGGPSGLTTLKHLITAHEFLPDVEPIEATLFEASASIGGTFRHRTYQDAEMVSSRQLTTFSDFRVPEAPDFLSTDEYCSYLELYCHRFQLWQHIKLCTPVMKLERVGESGHLVTYEQDNQRKGYLCDAVAICTGLHDVPNIPDIQGMDGVPNVMHSSQFKSREQFGTGKDVLILGTGETGMDIAHMAVTSDTKSVTLCHRDGFHVTMKRAPQPIWFSLGTKHFSEDSSVERTLHAPRFELSPTPHCLEGFDPACNTKDLHALSQLESDGFNRRLSINVGKRQHENENVPYDVGSASLFETAYAHPWLSGKSKNSKSRKTCLEMSGLTGFLDITCDHLWLRKPKLAALPWTYYDRFTKWTVALISGTKAGLDQWCGEISAERYHASKIFFNKSTKAMPYISAPYRKFSILNAFRSLIVQIPISDTKGRHIDLAPWPTRFDEKGVVHFLDNGRPEYEVMKNKVVKPDIVILATGYSQSLNFLNETYPRPHDADIRFIWKGDDESVGYIGFVRPSFGAIPPLAELQAQVWVLAILKRLPSKLQHEDHYRLHHSPTSRIQYGVDHESYVYQLACDLGSAPSVIDVLSLGWKTMLSWALSANVNPKFRLVGPWRWNGARAVMEGEIWETVTRRKLIWGHLTLAVMPMFVFGSISLLLLIVECALIVFLAFASLSKCAANWVIMSSSCTITKH